MKVKSQSITRLSLILLVFLVFFVPRGCSLTKVVVGVDKEGRSGVFVFHDPSLIDQLKERELISTGEGLVEKRDYLFWVDYSIQVRASLKGLTEKGPYYLRARLPGRVYLSNADEIREGQAYWVLNSEKAGKITLKTRTYRYYAIFGFFLVLLGVLYDYFKSKNLTKNFPV